MIKFFRHIRQSLIIKNQSGTYLKYAIGEIILVVIGILIALQINNWNQKRLEHQEEYIILSNLKEDYQSAIEEFSSLNALRRDIISSATEIYGLSTEAIEKYPSHYLDSLIGKTLSAPTFNNKSGSLDVLLTSGKINLVSNQTLKKKLIEWPGDVADMIEDEINHSNLYVGKYSDLLDNYISWNDLFKSYKSSGIRFNKTSVERMPDNPAVLSDYKALLNNKEFLNTLNRRAIYCELTYGETTTLIEKAQDIIEMINNELYH
jgi:hypothetical protein